MKFIGQCVLHQVALVVKNPPANARDIRGTSSLSGSERCPGGGHGNPLQYSSPENPMDRGAWRAAVLGSHRFGHDRSDSTHILHFHIIEINVN